MNAKDHRLGSSELQRLLVQHAPELRSLVERRIPAKLKTVISADDVLQETWLAAFRHVDGFSNERTNAFMKWITTIATNKVVDSIKSATRVKRGGSEIAMCAAAGGLEPLSALFERLVGSGPTPSRDSSAREVADAVQVALSALPDDRRRAITLRHLQGYAPAEIALRMSKSVSAVNGLLFHGMKQLRDNLGDSSRFLSGDGRVAKNPIQPENQHAAGGKHRVGA